MHNLRGGAASGQFDGILVHHIPDAFAFYPDYWFLPAGARGKVAETTEVETGNGPCSPY